MRKWIVCIGIMLILILAGCQPRGEGSLLEKEVRKYQQYAVLTNYQFGFESQEQTSLKVVAAHDGARLYYIFQLRSPHKSNNEVSLYVDGEYFKTFTHSENNYEDVFILDAKAIPDGETIGMDFGWRLGVKEFTKKVKLVKEVEDIEHFQVLFMDAKGFTEKEFKSVYEYNNNIKGRFAIVLAVVIIVAASVFKGYQIIYQRHIERKLTDENYRRKLIDLNQFKGYFIGFVIIIFFISFFFINYSYVKNVEKEATIVEGIIFEERISGIDEQIKMKVTIPALGKGDYQTIIFEKPVGGGLDYRYEIEFKDDVENKSSIRLGSSGGLIHREVFENINYLSMELRVYDVFKEELVFYRKYYLKD